MVARSEEAQSDKTPAQAFHRSRWCSLRDARLHSGVCRSSSSAIRIGSEPSTTGGRRLSILRLRTCHLERESSWRIPPLPIRPKNEFQPAYFYPTLGQRSLDTAYPNHDAVQSRGSGTHLVQLARQSRSTSWVLSRPFSTNPSWAFWPLSSGCCCLFP